MKFIRIYDDYNDVIYPIGSDDCLGLINKTDTNHKPKLILHKKDFDILLDDGNDDSIYDLYDGILNWLSSGKAYGEHTNVFHIKNDNFTNFFSEIKKTKKE